MIKAVLFDIDGVLLNSFEANLKFFQDLMTKAGYQPPTRDEYKSLFHVSMWDCARILSKSTSEDELKRIWELGKSDDVPYPTELLTSFPHMEETIQFLHKIYPLGIVTSRVREGIYEIPALQNMRQYFDVTVSYEDTVNHKPHPEPLLFACTKLGIDPSNGVYIGDVENDMIAGKKAGMKTILFSKQNVKDADASTSSFVELPKIIKSFA